MGLWNFAFQKCLGFYLEGMQEYRMVKLSKHNDMKHKTSYTGCQ